MIELNDITSYAAIVRDIAFVLLCIVGIVAVIAVFIAVRKVTRRFEEAMDRVDSLLDSLIAVRDALAEAQKRMRERAKGGDGRSGRGFNVASWLFSPLRYIIERKVRERTKPNGKSGNS